MSMPSTSPTPISGCSCRLPWVLATVVVIASTTVLLALAWRLAPPASAPAASLAAPTPLAEEMISTLRHDLEETRRILNDAQSGLAQRDREIAAANDDLRTLRAALNVGTKATATPPNSP